MENPININDYCNFRLISILTPKSFLEPLQIISTVFSIESKSGETKIKEQDALNCFSADVNNGFSKLLQKHTSIEDAIKFHNSLTILK